MNIANPKTPVETPQAQQKNDPPAVSNSDKISSSQKPEDSKENKDNTTQGEFKKLLEEPKSTDKISIEQALQNSSLNPEIQNQDYASKFGFDTISSFKNLKPLYNYDSMSISKDDAKFFADLVENKQFAIQQNSNNANLIKFADEIGPTYKTQQTSQVLSDLINKAYNDQKPVRIDFDNNVSVILKIDSKGKVSAEFIPGDKAVEAYLRNNIGFLKQRFDEQNLPYNDLMYRQSNQNNQNKEKQQQKKDKGE